MNAALMLQALLNPDRHLRAQSIMARINRRANNCGEFRIHHNLAADNHKSALLSRICSPRLVDQKYFATAQLVLKILVFQNIRCFPIQPFRTSLQNLPVFGIARAFRRAVEVQDCGSFQEQ